MNKYKRQISTMELNKRKVLVYKVKDGNKEPEHKGKSKGRGNNLPMGTMGMKGRTGFRKSVGSKDDKMEQEESKEKEKGKEDKEKRSNKDFRSMFNL